MQTIANRRLVIAVEDASAACVAVQFVETIRRRTMGAAGASETGFPVASRTRSTSVIESEVSDIRDMR